MRLLAVLLLAATACAQDVSFLCPMDPEIRSPGPGRCSRCGMKLEAGLPEPLEYRLHVETLPAVPRSGRTTRIRFSILHPATGKPVRQFSEIHEKLFHLFLIGEDLSYFSHLHPEQQPDGSFLLYTVFPRAGQYRLLADFYPSGATPQLLTGTVIVAEGPVESVPPAPSNTTIRLRSDPAEPVAGLTTMLFFDFSSTEGLTPWLGAWAHLLVASSDLLDLIHLHPQWELQPDIAPTVQFNVIFPRPGSYKLWVQFQRNGIINTHPVEIVVKPL